MMMKKVNANKDAEYIVNLAVVDDDGSFKCPKCGAAISPDDTSEETYQVLDTKLMNDELYELLISCGKCGSVIKVTGFQ